MASSSMTADIRVLETGAVKAEQSVIELLEDYLGKAQAGELRSIALAAVGNDGFVHSAHSKMLSTSEMLGAVLLLQYFIARDQ